MDWIDEFAANFMKQTTTGYSPGHSNGNSRISFWFRTESNSIYLSSLWIQPYSAFRLSFIDLKFAELTESSKFRINLMKEGGCRRQTENSATEWIVKLQNEAARQFWMMSECFQNGNWWAIDQQTRNKERHTIFGMVKQTGWFAAQLNEFSISAIIKSNSDWRPSFWFDLIELTEMEFINCSKSSPV